MGDGEAEWTTVSVLTRTITGSNPGHRRQHLSLGRRSLERETIIPQLGMEETYVRPIINFAK